jgi:hypothetical protein
MAKRPTRRLSMVRIPSELIEELNQQWDALRDDPAVRALDPRATASGAVRCTLYLALQLLKSGGSLTPAVAPSRSA